MPCGWAIANIGFIAAIVTDGEHQTPRRCNKFCGYYLLSARNILNDKITLDDVDYVDEAEYLRISTRCNPTRNDILVSCSGSVGRVAVVRDDNHYVMVRSAAMIRPIIITPVYVMLALQSESLQEQIISRRKQVAQANLFQAEIKSLALPIPPLAEQHRIVAAVESTFAVIGEIERSREDLQTTVAAAKSKILSLAIRGKLVPQDPTDEPASVLLERIRK
jgi:type I restriction enzyme S subunit